ncbi:hypothetical protein [Hymenobacter terrenus]|uniref:hypothetical protein n=1 Tax=Hymenobacter terrenus TaxID=1629124 RepID=UPI000619B468|nr:hypothetical protein [Hymenobacter terrenus]
MRLITKRWDFQGWIITAKPWTLFAASLLLTRQGAAQSVELFPGHRNTQVDVQWLKPFRPDSRFLLFSRSRYTVDYENRTGYFISGITAYGFKNGLGLANEILVDAGGLTPKVGVQYLKPQANSLVYAWLNVGYADREARYGGFIILRYLPALSERWRLYSQLELAADYTAQGHQFSAVRPRLGLGLGAWPTNGRIWAG